MAALPPGPRAPAAWQTLGWTLRPAAFLQRAHARFGDPVTIRTYWTEEPMVLFSDPDSVRDVFHLDPRIAPAGQSWEFLRPFAGSDFSPADLGLEFLHWPAQKLIKGEMRMGRWCDVLESAHPQPPPGAYARVVSWVDHETGGLIRAEAHDARGRLVKTFSLRNFKKVDGRWQLKEMEIINETADTRTRLEFDLTVDAGESAPPAAP